jgi:16S rRNA (cytidine1402-2'-O)-methyltransferase
MENIQKKLIKFIINKEHDMEEEKIGKLYIVATPIGNLDDITLRAINILKNVDLIAAEDTRHTLKLLNHLEISKPLISYHRHNEDVKTDILIEKLLEGQNIALVSDAGTPGICDPGETVIKKCIEDGINIIPIPGACAMVNALIASGINTKEFTFLGFLPLNKKLRKEKLNEIEKSNKTIIVYEAPHKLMSTLEDLKEILGDRQIVLARELTKIHEEFIRGSIQEIIDNTENLKGEIVLIIEENKKDNKENEFIELSLEEHYKLYEKQGLEKKEIIKKIAKDRGVSKNEVYQKFI